MEGSMNYSQADGPRKSSLRRWTIGEVTITRIVESQLIMDLSSMLPRATVEAILALPWLQPHFVTPEGQGIISFHALVVDTPSKRIVVDTCIGNDKDRAGLPHFHELQTSFLHDLEAGGFPRDSVDIVLCTHLHVDHVGWNTMLENGKWVPTFPNARYLLSKTEYEYWRGFVDVSTGFAEIQRLTFADSITPVVNAGLVDLVDGEHRVCDEVTLVPTLGHSPGHVSVRIRAGGEEALITGDMVHHPCQLAHVEWGLPDVDFDTDQAMRTRQRVFSEVADKPILVIGTHWADPTAGNVKRSGDAFRLEL
jgi:glyoxylase-like metal-dependent hydrolase (beta-lactamase superfamily II)